MAVGHYDRKMDHAHQPQDSPSRDADKYIVRFPDGMRDQLKEAAKASGRSLNAEIIHRLQHSLASEGQAVIRALGVMRNKTPMTTVASKLAALRERIASARAEQVGLFIALAGDEVGEATQRSAWRKRVGELSDEMRQLERQLNALEDDSEQS